MEQTIRLILLVVGAIVVLWILYDGIKRQKRLKGEVDATEDTNDVVEPVIEPAIDIPDEKTSYAFEERVEENISEPETEENIPEPTVVDEVSDDQKEVADSVIMLMLVPEKGQVFAGSVLLQSLFSHDLHYGDQQIFHHYAAASENLDKPLFSVASASESGEFDLDSMRENSYRGLVVFMEPNKHLHPADVFDMMIGVANYLAADLHGQLLSGDQQIWSDEVAAEVRATI